MDDDVFNVPMDASCQYSIIEDGKYTRPTSISLVQPYSHYMNNQNQVMAEFPALFMTQGEFLNHLHWDPHLQNHAEIPISTTMAPKSLPLERVPDKEISIGRSCPTSNIENRDLYIADMPNSVDSCATLLSGKSGSGEKLYGKQTPTPSTCAHEIQETFVSSDYFDTLQHSLGTYRNEGDGGRLDNIRSKKNLHDSIATHIAGAVHQRPLLEPFKIMGDMDQNWWISAENTRMSSDNTSGSSIYSSERSPSRSISQPSVICAMAIAEHCSEISGSGLCNRSLPDGRIGLGQASSSINNLSLNIGYKSVQRSNLFSGSRFLRELQEILAELASYSFGSSGHISYFADGTSATTVNFSRSPNQPAERSYTAAGPDRFSDGDYVMMRGQEAETRKNLLNLLQMVDNQYNRCLDEIHKVISAFHAVTELDPRIHAHFALQTVDILYKNLRERISNSVLAIGARLNEGDRDEEERSFETLFIQKQWALQQLRKKDHQLWRPQRGLPERSVSILRAWMFQNFLHPYPKDAEKHLLAVKSGLTRSQVSNWFINARVRIWKPMIDEMYLEMNRRKAHQNAEETDSLHRSLISINSNRFRMN